MTRQAKKRPLRDEFDYIRNFYGVNPHRGMRVTAYGKPGTIQRADGQYIMILVDGDKFARPYHPTDQIDYTASAQGLPVQREPTDGR